MSRDTKKSQIEFSESGIKEIGFRAYLNSQTKTAFNAGYSLAQYLHATSMATVNQILASVTPAQDTPTPPQDTPSTAPQPAAAVQPAALPEPAAEATTAPALEEAPEDYFKLA